MCIYTYKPRVDPAGVEDAVRIERRLHRRVMRASGGGFGGHDVDRAAQRFRRAHQRPGAAGGARGGLDRRVRRAVAGPASQTSPPPQSR